MATPKRAATTLAAALLAGLIAGCTPTAATPTTPTPSSSSVSPSSTPPTTPPVSSSPSPSPTTSLSSGQRAALAAVEGYTRISHQIGSDPSKYSESQMVKLHQRYTGGAVLTSSVGSFVKLKKRGYRWEGEYVIQSVRVSKVSSDSRKATVTACQDQREIAVVDKAGKPVPSESVMKFNLRQYTLLKPAGTWLIYEMKTVDGKCGE